MFLLAVLWAVPCLLVLGVSTLRPSANTAGVVVFAIGSALPLPFLILAPMRHRLLPVLGTVSLAIAAVLLILMGIGFQVSMARQQTQIDEMAVRNPEAAEHLQGALFMPALIGGTMIVALLALAVWGIFYLWRSRRVRLVCRHQIRADEAVQWDVF